MTYKDAEKIILNAFLNSEILDAVDTPSAYVFTIQPIGTKDPILDNMYSVNKKTGEIKGYVLSLHGKEYNEAIKHPIYKKR